MKIIILYIMFFGIYGCQSQSISGYRNGDKALIKFLEKELTSLNDEVYKRNTIIYTEVYFNSKGDINKVSFFENSNNSDLKEIIKNIFYKTKGKWIKRKENIPLLIPISFVDMRMNKVLIDIDDLFQPLKRPKKISAQKYIFLYPITLGQPERR